MISLFTRRRRDEVLPYADCYDELLNGKETGRIVRTFRCEGNKVIYEYVDGYSTINDDVPTTKDDTVEEYQVVLNIPKKIVYDITVNHHYGSSVFKQEEDRSIWDSKYIEYLESIFWKGFVHSIDVNEREILDD